MATIPAKTVRAESKENKQGFFQEERIVVYGHSQLIFWWPVWVYGFILAIYASVYVAPGQTNDTYNTLNLVYIFLLSSIIAFTNLRVSVVVFTISSLLGAGLITLIKLKTNIVILKAITENMHVSMNMQFHLVFNGVLFVIWIVGLLHDRSERLIVERGGAFEFSSLLEGTQHISPSRAIIKWRRGDFVCHWVLGLGRIGDLSVHTDTTNVHLRNVSLAGKRKVVISGWENV
jgi:hypothetical protein